jgi:glutamate-1-semialdehyde 2,1-aminomutase
VSDFPDVSKSIALYKRAGEIIPGWTQLISRRASQFANGVNPVYAQSAKGSRFVDVDGNEFIDWINCVGAVILGHADEVVDAAVKEQIDRGSLYTVNNPLEVELAEELIATIPSAEMVRYTKGGADSCAVAVRIARGTSNKDKILFCGYHGWHDWYQSANYLVNPESGEYPFAGIEPTGVPKVLAGTAIPFSDGDLDMLERLFEENKGEVAAVMMEPARSELPEPGYLEAVKEITHKNDAFLIFDEVSCGWRYRIAGIQEAVGVTPDMTALAKAMGNGYAMGAVVGSREVMEPAGRMFISSSYWSDNVGLAAAITTIRELKRRKSEQFFEEYGEKVRAAMNDAIATAGLSGSCTGLHVNVNIALDLPDPSLQPVVSTLFVQEMARRGIHCHMGFKANMAHTDEDLKITARAATEALQVIKAGLDKGDVASLLVCDTKEDPFRRQVT